MNAEQIETARKSISDAVDRLMSAEGGPLAEIRRMGVRGRPVLCGGCVVAVALQKLTALPVRVTCGSAMLPPALPVNATRAPLPRELLDVVRDFDLGRLPDLLGAA